MASNLLWNTSIESQPKWYIYMTFVPVKMQRSAADKRHKWNKEVHIIHITYNKTTWQQRPVITNRMWKVFLLALQKQTGPESKVKQTSISKRKHIESTSEWFYSHMAEVYYFTLQSLLFKNTSRAEYLKIWTQTFWQFCWTTSPKSQCTRCKIRIQEQ